MITKVAVDHIIIGGGIVGLSIGASLTKRLKNSKQSVVLFEKDKFLGNGTTSRNSEVIHAGIYYPTGSLKEQLCLKGKRLTYEICQRNGIDYSKCGKWVVSTSNEDDAYLERMLKKMKDLEVEGYFLSTKKGEEMEPTVKAKSILVSPTSGIIDSHGFLRYFENEFINNGGNYLLNTEVVEVKHDSLSLYPYQVLTRDCDGNYTEVLSRTVINSAGLFADDIVSKLYDKTGLSFPKEFKIYPVKGFYYRFRKNVKLVSRLVYPSPENHLSGLGIHCTIDLSGRVRFGPNVEHDYCEENDDSIVRAKKDYMCPSGGVIEVTRRRKFWDSLNRYLNLKDEDFNNLTADYAGIRPKLSSKKNPSFRDFVIQDEKRSGFTGFINLLGIESPGITASPAIGEYVVNNLMISYL